MEKLSILKAANLYRTLKPFLPEALTTNLEYIQGIVNSIKEKEPKVYLEATSLMSGKSIQDLIQLDPLEVLDLFTTGLSVNKIVTLRDFFSKLENSNA